MDKSAAADGTPPSDQKRLLHQAEQGQPPVSLAWEDLDSAVAEQGWVWLDIERPSPETVTGLAGRFGWDALTVEDVLDDAPLSKFADYDDHVFVVLHALARGGSRVTTVEVDAYLSARMLVTLRHDGIAEIDALWKSVASQPRISGPDTLLARVADAVCSGYLPVVGGLDDRIDVLEEQAIKAEPVVVPAVQALRHDLTILRRYLAPQREVLLALAREGATTQIQRRARQRFADVYEQVHRAVESLDGSRIVLAFIHETYRSAVAEDMNRVMKVLTVFSAILFPLTLIAGIYGMNFANMPELQWPRGYFYILGSMVAVAVALWIWFVRAGFIGGPKLRDLPRTVGLGLLSVATLPVRGLSAVVRSVGGIVEGGNSDVAVTSPD